MQIVALKPGGEIVALEEQPFDLEVGLQKLLEHYPRLMLSAGSTYQDRSVWTIGYEVGTDAGSIDLLMLDSTGEVWVVETKLRKNPEVKKQVVGQVLGYASCVAEWSIDRLREVAQAYLGRPLLDYIGDDVGLEEAENIIVRAIEKLRQGDLTALIVVDDLPRVLQRLVEFVNDHSAFDLLAMQVTMVEHDGTRFVVPTITGGSVTKSVSPTGASDKSYADLFEASSDEFKEMVARLDDWALESGYETVLAAKSKKYVTPEGRFALRVFPQWDSLQMWLSSLYEAGMDQEANALRERFRRITGEKVPKQEIHAKSGTVLDKWDEMVAFIADYIAALKVARS